MGAKIYQLPQQLVGSVGLLPNFKYMVSGDDLITVTTPGYLNQVDLQSNPIASDDIIQMLYDYNSQTQTGSYNAFSVSISEGIITLIAEISAGNVIFPVISGNVAKFSGIDGAIADAGFSAANVAVTPSLPVVINSVPIYSSTGGNLSSSGSIFTDLINRNTYNSFNFNSGLFFNSIAYNAPGGAVSVTSQAGIITTDSLTLAPGSSYTVTITPSFVLANNCAAFLQLKNNGTNTAGNSISFTYNVAGFSAPLVVTIENDNAAALNGTLVFTYFVVR